MPTTTSASLSGFNDSIESKYTVAEILSSMTGGEALTPSTLAAAVSFSTGVVTGTTPTLTPTTLNTIEQTFIQLQNTSNGHQYPQDVSRESGFVPPVIEPISTMPVPVHVKSEIEYFDESSHGSEDSGAPSTSKRLKTDAGAYSVPDIDPNTYLVANSRRPTGPRKYKKTDDQLTQEDAVKKAQRRERNKLAAAKCRKRREDHTSRLINETEGLEEEKAQLESEIQSLSEQKDQLEFILQAHTTECRAGLNTVKATTNNATLGQKPVQSNSGKTINTFTFSSSRPNTLPISSTISNNKTVHSVVTEALGVNLNTPTSVMKVFNFDTMVEGHTGLTPLTEVSTSIQTMSASIPTTSCAGQLKKRSDSSSSNELSSPTTLVSL